MLVPFFFSVISNAKIYLIVGPLILLIAEFVLVPKLSSTWASIASVLINVLFIVITIFHIHDMNMLIITYILYVFYILYLFFYKFIHKFLHYFGIHHNELVFEGSVAGVCYGLRCKICKRILWISPEEAYIKKLSQKAKWTGNTEAAIWSKNVLFWYALGSGVLSILSFQHYLQEDLTKFV